MSDSGSGGDNQSVHQWLKYRTLLLNFVLEFFFFFFFWFPSKKKNQQLFQQTAPGFPWMCVSGMMLLLNLVAILQTEGRKTVVISKLLKILDIVSKVSQADSFPCLHFLKMNHKKPRQWIGRLKPTSQK